MPSNELSLLILSLRIAIPVARNIFLSFCIFLCCVKYCFPLANFLHTSSLWEFCQSLLANFLHPSALFELLFIPSCSHRLYLCFELNIVHPLFPCKHIAYQCVVQNVVHISCTPLYCPDMLLIPFRKFLVLRYTPRNSVVPTFVVTWGKTVCSYDYCFHLQTFTDASWHVYYFMTSRFLQTCIFIHKIYSYIYIFM